MRIHPRSAWPLPSVSPTRPLIIIACLLAVVIELASFLRLTQTQWPLLLTPQRILTTAQQYADFTIRQPTSPAYTLVLSSVDYPEPNCLSCNFPTDTVDLSYALESPNANSYPILDLIESGNGSAFAQTLRPNALINFSRTIPGPVPLQFQGFGDANHILDWDLSWTEGRVTYRLAWFQDIYTNPDEVIALLLPIAESLLPPTA